MRNSLQKSSTFFSNGLVYGLNGIYTIMPIYLAKYFDSVQMGYLLAIQPLLLCIAPLFWGEITDKAKSQNFVMALLVAGATISICAIPFNPNFYFVATALFLYSIFQSPFGSLIDVLTIRASEKFGMNYGFFRVIGAVLYGFMAFIVTLLTNTEYAFYVYAITSVLACVTIYGMPKVTGIPKKAVSKDIRSKALFSNKELWVLILIISAPYFAWGYYHNFFPTYITETLGLSKSVWGIVAFLTAFSEVPFFFYYNRIFRKFRLKYILAISCFIIAIRLLVYTFVTNTSVLVAVSFITGLFITVLIYCITRYIVAAISPGLVNRAQSLAYAFGTGIPKMLAGCVGGYMTKYFGVTNSFLICAVLVFMSFILTVTCKNVMDSIDEKVYASKFKK